MKHHSVTGFYKPIGIRSMDTDTFFRRNDCGTASDGKNLQASKANRTPQCGAGYLHTYRVYSPGQMNLAVQPGLFKIKIPAALRLPINAVRNFQLDPNGAGPGANLQFEARDGDCAGEEQIEFTFLRNSNIPRHAA